MKILALRSYCATHAGDRSERRTTRQLLQDFGFSRSFIDAFFRPFYTGIFLEDSLETSAAVFTYTFDRFSKGLAAIPANGMAEIPSQLAHPMSQADIQLNTTVTHVTSRSIKTKSGASFEANAVVLATPFHVTNELLGQPVSRKWKHTRCLYFASHHPPTEDPVLMLHREPGHPVNLVCVPSNVSTNLAPVGQHLICVSLNPGQKQLSAGQIQESLRPCFGQGVEQWRLLKDYHIPHALPNATASDLRNKAPHVTEEGIFICGDHCMLPTIDHALKSGLITAGMLQ